MLRRIRQAQILMDTACKKFGRDIHLMEICGTHTIGIARNAIRQSIPSSLKILTGPGCPICLTDTSYYNKIYQLTESENNILTVRPEMMNMRIGNKKLSQANGTIAVTSVLEALTVAKIHPDKNIIYAGIGFETCLPAAAIAVELAEKEQIKNFHLLTNFKIVTAAIEKTMAAHTDIDAFMCCGNMVAVTGFKEYEKIIKQFNLPCLPVGFEPMQLIEGIAEICRQLIDQKPATCFDFAVGASLKGNVIAQQYMNKYFEKTSDNWRTIGSIDNSAWKLREQYAKFDAVKKFNLSTVENIQEELSDCRCDEVISGTINPKQCRLFTNGCSREEPVGPCMASTMGPCNVWARYNRYKKQ